MGKKKKKSVKPLTQFTKDFMVRTKVARARTGYTQGKLGSLLGMDQGTYKNYETKRVLQARYIPTFCVICRVDAAWLFGMKDKIWEGEMRPEMRPGIRPTQGRGGRSRTRHHQSIPPVGSPAEQT